MERKRCNFTLFTKKAVAMKNKFQSLFQKYIAGRAVYLLYVGTAGICTGAYVHLLKEMEEQLKKARSDKSGCTGNGLLEQTEAVAY